MKQAFLLTVRRALPCIYGENINWRISKCPYQCIISVNKRNSVICLKAPRKHLFCQYLHRLLPFYSMPYNRGHEMLISINTTLSMMILKVRIKWAWNGELLPEMHADIIICSFVNVTRSSSRSTIITGQAYYRRLFALKLKSFVLKCERYYVQYVFYWVIDAGCACGSFAYL